MESITERRIWEASVSLTAKPGLSAEILGLNGTWIKARRCGHCEIG